MTPWEPPDPIAPAPAAPPLAPTASFPSDALLDLQAQVESGGDPLAVSPKGAVGLHQFMPDTAAEYGIDPRDPQQSREGARRYLGDMYRRFGNDEELALMAYNWGPGNVESWVAGGRQGPVPQETRDYVSRLLPEARGGGGQRSTAGGWQPPDPIAPARGGGAPDLGEAFLRGYGPVTPRGGVSRETPVKPEPEEENSEFWKGFGGYLMQQGPEALSSSAKAIGIATGSDWLRNTAAPAIMELRGGDPEAFTPRRGTIDAIEWGRFGEAPGDVMGQIGDFAAYGLGQGLASTLPSLVAAIGGGAAGGAVGGPIGAGIGSLTGATGTSYLQNQGPLFDDLVDEGLSEKDAAIWSLAGAVPLAALDAAYPLVAAGKLTKGVKDEVRRGLVKRIVREAGKGFVQEGTTEALQELTSEAIVAQAAERDIDWKDAANRAATGFAIGGLTGGTVGGVTGLRGPREAEQQPEAPPAPEAAPTAPPVAPAPPQEEAGPTVDEGRAAEAAQAAQGTQMAAEAGLPAAGAEVTIIEPESAQPVMTGAIEAYYPDEAGQLTARVVSPAGQAMEVPPAWFAPAVAPQAPTGAPQAPTGPLTPEQQARRGVLEAAAAERNLTMEEAQELGALQGFVPPLSDQVAGTAPAPGETAPQPTPAPAAEVPPAAPEPAYPAPEAPTSPAVAPETLHEAEEGLRAAEEAEGISLSERDLTAIDEALTGQGIADGTTVRWEGPFQEAQTGQRVPAITGTLGHTEAGRPYVVDAETGDIAFPDLEDVERIAPLPPGEAVQEDLLGGPPVSERDIALRDAITAFLTDLRSQGDTDAEILADLKEQFDLGVFEGERPRQKWQRDVARGAMNELTREQPKIPMKEAVETAAAETETEPTEAQVEAGNYKKGKVRVQGLEISIENPKGSERRGRDASGKEWSVTMPAHYGYIKRSEGADGEQVDVYLGPEPENETVYVIDQKDLGTGKFDEHKVFIGFAGPHSVRQTYVQAFDDGRGSKRIMGIAQMTMDKFKERIEAGEFAKRSRAATPAKPATPKPAKAQQRPQLPGAAKRPKPSGLPTPEPSPVPAKPEVAPEETPEALATAEFQPAAPGQARVLQLADRLTDGESWDSITDLRREYGVKAGTEDAKMLDEDMESAVVRAGKRFLFQDRADDKSSLDSFRRLVDLYNRQPKLGTRTSTSVELQAYSTPVPIAYLASKLADIDRTTTVYEPTAGTGMLLINANTKMAVANELDPRRAQRLRDLGVKTVTQKDATDFVTSRPVDVVIMNPPFGVARDASGSPRTWDFPWGYRTSQIDHAIALNSLQAMPDGGSAVMLIAGPAKTAKSEEARSNAYNGKQKREFFKSLYDRYNVVEHITVAGELYSRQGAEWPIDIIVIRGRGKSGRALPAVDVPRVYSSFKELEDFFDGTYDWSALGAARPVGEEPAAAPGRPAERVSPEPAAEPERVPGGPVVPPVGPPGEGGRPEGGRPAGAGEVRRGEPSGRRGPAEGGLPGPVAGPRPGQPAVLGEPEPERGPEPGEVGRPPPGPAERPGGERAAEPQPGRVARPGDAEAARRLSEGETAPAQVPYRPRSSRQTLDTLVPVNLQGNIGNALGRLESEVGDVDSYVARELGYDPDKLGDYFSAEQVDAIALALANMAKNSGFIIGDQTGIGKGRVVAAMIRWALQNGKTPIFVTEKPNLYGDMYRDLSDIDVEDPQILMTNAAQRVPLTEDESVVLRTPAGGQHNAALLDMATNRRLADPYRMIFTTYAQMQRVKQNETPRMAFLRAMAPGSVIIFDESHNAGGTQKSEEMAKKVPDRSDFARELARTADAVMFSSATYAKRPSVMSLYAKTDMRHAVADIDDLGAAIQKGGVPLQQAVASMLTESGQYIRRERSFDGVTYDAPVVDVDENTYARFSAALKAIQDFSETHSGKAAKKADRAAKAEAKAVSADGSTGGAGAQSTNFTSIMHNLIEQMLLALKAPEAVARAEEALKRGEKPVLTVAYTMGSFIEDYARMAGLNPGDAMSLNFNQLLERYLERSRKITIKEPFSKEKGERVYLSDEDLGPEGVAAYDRARQVIAGSDFSALPVSPIDYIKGELQARGYKIDEITGRTATMGYTGTGQGVYKTRTAKETGIPARRRIITRFNSGDLDALVINQAGSTGLSLHASEKVKDRRKRHMIIVQPEKNIDTHMQMLGRVHRTGQVVTPAYTQMVAGVPAEKRPAAVLAKKMASLNANTTAARGGALTAENVPDFMNQYGDRVAAQVMQDNPELHDFLGEPLDATDVGLETEDAARKVTGRIPLLPVEDQEAVYDMIEGEYDALIQQLDAAGENALEAKTLPLDAVTEESIEAVPSKGLDSPFAAPVTAEIVDVKRIGKPFTGEQVIAAVRKETGKEGDDLASVSAKVDITDPVRAFHRYQEGALEKISDDKKRDAQEVRLSDIWNRFSDLTRFQVGDSVRLKTDEENLYGVVTRIRRAGKTRNPLALGAWKMRVYTTDARRQIEIPFSHLFTDERDPRATAADSIVIEKAEKIGSMPIIRAFDEMQQATREKRGMLTGNLLAAYDHVKGKGQIVNYTTRDGDLRQGILMPRGFDYRTWRKDRPVAIANPVQMVEFMTTATNEQGELSTGDKALKITAKNGMLQLKAAAAKDRGAQYYLDQGLRDAIGQDFVKVGNEMRAEVPLAQAGTVLGVLNDKGIALYATDHLGAAREVTGTDEAVKPGPEAKLGRAGGIRVFHGGPREIVGTPRLTQNAIAPLIGFSVTEDPDVGRRFASEQGGKGAVTSFDLEVSPDQIVDFWSLIGEVEAKYGDQDVDVTKFALDRGYKVVYLNDPIHGAEWIVLDPSVLRKVEPSLGKIRDEAFEERLRILAEGAVRASDEDIAARSATAEAAMGQALRDRAAADRRAIAEAIVTELRRIAPAARWRPVSRIEPDYETAGEALRVSGVQLGETIGGFYENGVITMALDSVGPPSSAARMARHEGIHFLRQAGFFTPQEWTILERESQRRWLKRFGLPQEPDNAQIVEEGIAYAFQHWRRDGMPVRPAIQRLFARMAEFFARLGNALRGLGFQSVDDVFQRTAAGEVGRRQRGQVIADLRRYAGVDEDLAAQAYEVAQVDLARINEILPGQPMRPGEVAGEMGERYGFLPSDPMRLGRGRQPQATLMKDGREFWSGAFDTRDGEILEVHDYERARQAEFRHRAYFSPQTIQAMDEGTAAFFFVTPTGGLEFEWRTGAPPPEIRARVHEQVMLPGPMFGVADLAQRYAEKFGPRKGDLPTAPNVGVEAPEIERDLSPLKRPFYIPSALFKGWPALAKAVDRWTRRHAEMQSSLSQVQREWTLITEGLSDADMVDLSSILFKGDTDQQAYTQEDLDNITDEDGEPVILSPAAKAAYPQARALIDKLGRLTDQHERAMRNYLRRTIKPSLIRTIAKESVAGLTAAKEMLTRRYALRTMLQNGTGDPEQISARLERIEDRLGYIRGSDTRLSQAIDQLDIVDATLNRTSIRRRDAEGNVIPGYVPHKFFGSWAVYRLVETETEEGETETHRELVADYAEHGFHPSQEAAIEAANRYAEDNPETPIVVRPVNMRFAGTGATELRGPQYQALMGRLQDALEIDREQLQEAVGGALRPRSKRMWAGFKQYRRGVEGYSRDLEKVMRAHIGEVIRYVYLDKVKYEAITIEDRMRLYEGSRERPILGTAFRAYVRDILGAKQPLEANLDEFFERGYMAPLNFAMGSGIGTFVLAGGLTGNPFVGLLMGSWVGWRFYVARQKAGEMGGFATRGVTGELLSTTAHIKLGAFFNLFSPIVNLTQLFLNTASIVPYRYMGQGLAMVNKAVGQHFAEVAASKAQSRAYRDPPLIRMLRRHNIDPVFKHSEISPHMYDKPSLIARLSMFAFDTVEKFNRSATFFAGYQQAIQGQAPGVPAGNVAAAQRYGMDVVNRTQFDYSNVMKPEILRNVFLRVPLQFKNFVAQQIAFVAGLKRPTGKGYTGWANRDVARFLTHMFIVAGALGLPGWQLLDWLVEWLTEESPSVEVKRWALEMQARGEMDGTFANVIARGMPALVGVDISTRAGMGERFLPAFQLSELIGPLPSTILRANQLAQNEAGIVDQLRNLSSGLGGPLKALQSAANGMPIETLFSDPDEFIGKFGDTKSLVTSPYKKQAAELPPDALSNAQLMLMAVGGSPREMTEVYDRAAVDNKAIRDRKEKVGKYMNRIAQAYRRHMPQDVNAYAQEAGAIRREAYDEDGIIIPTTSIRTLIRDLNMDRAMRSLRRAPRQLRPELWEIRQPPE